MSEVIKRHKWRLKDGSISNCWKIDTYINGIRYRKTGFKTKGDAQRHLEALTPEKASEDKKLIFLEAANDFMNLHAQIHCKPSTVEFYEVMFRKHLIPFFGQSKVVDIKPAILNEYISLKMSEGLANKTINHHITLLSSVFQKLIENDAITTNPAKKVKKLRLPYQEMLFLEQDEIKVLLDAAEKYYPDFYPLLFTAIFTGMRKGELLALTWNDINFRSRKINVNKAIYKGKISTPKTEKSIRKIDMPHSLVKVLKEWKIRSSSSNIVFSNREGNHLDPDNIIKRQFNPCLSKTGVTYVRFHDLRHTYASMLIAQNVPIKYIQNQMGHSSIQVTMDRYGHIMPEVHEYAVNVLDDLIRSKPKTEKPQNKDIEIK